MPESISFQAQLWRVSQDQDGESKVTFAISLQELHKILKLGEWTQRLLKVKVEVDQ